YRLYLSADCPTPRCEWTKYRAYAAPPWPPAQIVRRDGVMPSLNAQRGAPAATGHDPQAIDRHGSAINPPDNTAPTEPATLSYPAILALQNATITELLHAVEEQRTEIEMLWTELEALQAAAAYCEMCGSSPCINPSFCATCRRIEKQQAPQPRCVTAPC